MGKKGGKRHKHGGGKGGAKPPAGAPAPGETGQASGPSPTDELDERDSDASSADGDEGAADGDEAAAEPAASPAPDGPAGEAAARAADGDAAPKKPVDDEPKAAWGEPIVRFEAAWTKLETRLLVFVLVWQILVLVSWVCYAGLSSPVSSGTSAGTVFRAGVGAVVLGIAAWVGGKRLEERPRTLLTLVAVGAGLLLAKGWRTVGVDYFDNFKGWLQEGSTLTLMGGLRGLATRLTLWMALLGASLATAMGKHIHVDVVFRFLPKRLRLPALVINYSATALVCFAGAWGFVDHIAVQGFAAKQDDGTKTKLEHIVHGMGEHAFLTRKQLRLDVKLFPRVLTGTRYDQALTAAEWNEFIRDAGFTDRYKPEEVAHLVVPDDSPPHSPLVISPDGDTARGMLVHDLNLVFPVGLIAIALRFLLRALLALSRQVKIDPDAAHQELDAEART